MSKLGFGQPLGALVQFAYLTEDIERGMLDFAERLGVGPVSYTHLTLPTTPYV